MLLYTEHEGNGNVLNLTESSVITQGESNLPVAPLHIGDRHKSKLPERSEGLDHQLLNPSHQFFTLCHTQSIQEIQASWVSREVNWELDLNLTQAEVTKRNCDLLGRMNGISPSEEM